VIRLGLWRPHPDIDGMNSPMIGVIWGRADSFDALEVTG
jgi:hypothetical protein